MPKRTALNSIHVHRDGKLVVVKPGTVFDFTAEELADIKAVSPDAVRVVINEESNESDEARMVREAKELDDANALAKKEADDRAAKEKADKEAAKEKAIADAKAAKEAGKNKPTTSASDL